ncbi:NCS2 family permease [Peribacillus huizhouensis]|uniref:AGZA family xanthine/uracil permease-like MFS transporter n=1 Tax=Peribacillus huizhouensis TaxID=1501239 RepID=A0ABR6CTK1_9BACI|nr:NCS2 family permease [Peribacillus huizhouensis]MBA9027672.1 AGZA family xanthine/uracil permease-like MFS transporter [Peribacillus huizhouensis]
MKKTILESYFKFAKSGTTGKREVMAGLVSYFTIVYIIVVNSMILSEAGIPLNGAILATIFISAIGCIFMGLYANMPIILVPGMGINAMFAYTMVQGMGLTWQSALACVSVSGLIFVAIAYSRFLEVINASIPSSLKEAISIGLGLFLLFLGLEKGGLITAGSATLLQVGNFGSAEVIATTLTIILAFVLFIRNVPGNFLLTIIIGTVIAYICGTINLTDITFTVPEVSEYKGVFFALTFVEIHRFEFWIAVFSMTMVLVFENIGLVHGYVNSVGQPDRYKKAFQATGISVLLSGLFGSSPPVATVETAAGIATGGRTGFTSIVTGILFIFSLLFVPVIKVIPNSAIAPILIIIGILMLSNIKHLDFVDFSESIPAIMIIVMIPYTLSIPDGMAVGFILYPVLKIAAGKAQQVSKPMYFIATLFLVYFVIGVIS